MIRCRCWHVEVGDADRGGRALCLQREHRPPGLDEVAGRGGGPVDEVEVHMIQAEQSEALVHGPHGVVVAVIGVPDLGRDEQVGTRQAARRDSPTDAALVVVERGRVDVAVSALEGGEGGVRDDVVGHLPHAEADLRDGEAVVEREGGDRGHASSLAGAAIEAIRRCCRTSVPRRARGWVTASGSASASPAS